MEVFNWLIFALYLVFCVPRFTISVFREEYWAHWYCQCFWRRALCARLSPPARLQVCVCGRPAAVRPVVPPPAPGRFRRAFEFPGREAC